MSSSAQEVTEFDRSLAAQEVDARTRQLEEAGLVEKGVTPPGTPSYRAEQRSRRHPPETP